MCRLRVRLSVRVSARIGRDRSGSSKEGGLSCPPSYGDKKVPAPVKVTKARDEVFGVQSGRAVSALFVQRRDAAATFPVLSKIDYDKVLRTDKLKVEAVAR